MTIRRLNGKVLKFICSIILILMLQSVALGQQSSAYFVLQRKVPVTNQELQDAYFIIHTRDGVRRLAAELFSAFESRENQAERLIAAVRIPLPKSGQIIKHSLLLVLNNNQISFLPIEELEFPVEQFLSSGSDGIRQKLITVKQEVQSWQAQYESQKQSIERLRADAEVIGSLSRLSEIRQDIEDLRASQEDVRETIEGLNLALREVKQHSKKPPGFARRQAQLIKQVALLADAARSAESTEISRRRDQEALLRGDLELIELNRFEDPAMLQSRLEHLRKKRVELEKQVQAQNQAQG